MKIVVEKNPYVKTAYMNRISQIIDRMKKIKPVLESDSPLPISKEQQGSEHQSKKSSRKDTDAKDLEDQMAQAIVTEKPNIKWEDIAGLKVAKSELIGAVVLPINQPQLFTGKREPWKGILLYGPPGTGKSYIAKAVASQADSTFMSVSSSDLMSKYVGESPRYVENTREKFHV